ncbi:hypothetical protein ACHAO7_010760 [Fusarium culmorum]
MLEKLQKLLRDSTADLEDDNYEFLAKLDEIKDSLIRAATLRGTKGLRVCVQLADVQSLLSLSRMQASAGPSGSDMADNFSLNGEHAVTSQSATDSARNKHIPTTPLASAKRPATAPPYEEPSDKRLRLDHSGDFEFASEEHPTLTADLIRHHRFGISDKVANFDKMLSNIEPTLVEELQYSRLAIEKFTARILDLTESQDRMVNLEAAAREAKTAIESHTND